MVRAAPAMLPGLLGDSVTGHRAQSRQRKPTILSLRRQSGGPSGRPQGQQGVARTPDRSLAAKSQTNMVFTVRSARAASQEQTRRAHGYWQAWPAPTGPDEVSRPSVAFGGARAVPDCLGSLRPSERNGAEAQLVKRTRKWSGAAAKLASQSSCAAEPCGSGEGHVANSACPNRVTWREARAQVSAR